jgi:hypothetical protein
MRDADDRDRRDPGADAGPGDAAWLRFAAAGIVIAWLLAVLGAAA